MGLFDELESAAEMAVANIDVSSRVYNSETLEAEQKTKEWFAARLGNITASRMNKIATLLKNGDFSAVAKTELMTIAIERTLTDEGREMYIAEQMGKEYRQTRWGTKYEPICRELANATLGLNIEEVGFVAHGDIENFGGSVDGVSDEYVFEIKCPYDMVKHEKTLRTSAIDRTHEYYPQFQSHLMNYPTKSGCFFISFDPRRDADHRLKVILVERDNDYIDWLKTIIEKAENYINGAI